MAARGYCGIAQDVRLLYKTLASCPDIEVTGLVYHPRKFAPVHKFLPPDASRGCRLTNQAVFLWALGEEASAWPAFQPFRMVQKLHRMAATICTRRVQLDRLDAEMLWNVVWRLLFNPTLSPEDSSLVQNGKFLLSNLSDGMIYARALTNRRPFTLDTRGYDFLIVEGPRPFRISPETRQIVRYHDMIPMLQPDTMSNPLVIQWHHKAIRQSPEGALFVCSSEPTRDDLTRVHPELSARSATIPCTISDAYRPDPDPNLIRSIIKTRCSGAAGVPSAKPLEESFRYLMCVSTLEPRKNFVNLIQAFNALRLRPSIKQRISDLKLLIVGSPGWNHETILASMRQPIGRGELVHLEKVSAEELRVLYTHAEAFVFPSHSEGFGMPPLEAMLCDAPVIASDIPAHRWVMGEAALYCNPYDVTSIAAALERLVASDESLALRGELIARGRERLKSYRPDRCARQWSDLLHRLKQELAVANAFSPVRLSKTRLLERVV
ncbi:MAG: glycosyltransferase family 4 protein [Planctomycetia bacterium]|nr:glycosyltransferase family 4 protein [Planctomycetia bacterium]